MEEIEADPGAGDRGNKNDPVTVRVSAPAGFEPEFASAGAAGADLRAHITVPHTVNPGERIAIPTGVRIEIPQGFEGQVRPRSGLALKHGITLANSPGTIDSDYRGEIVCPVINLGTAPFTIPTGMRIAQLVVARVEQPHYVQTETLQESKRGANGFGSTGVR